MAAIEPDGFQKKRAPFSFTLKQFGTRLFEAVFAGELGIVFPDSLQGAQSQNADLH